MNQEIESFTLLTISAALGLPEQEVLAASNLFDLGLDSFAFMQIISTLELKFQVLFEPEDFMSPNFQSVHGIGLELRKKVQSRHD